jgi:hypothetical protein
MTTTPAAVAASRTSRASGALLADGFSASDELGIIRL